MVLQRAVKTYPLVKWLVAASLVLVVAGVWQSRILTAPNDAHPMTLVWFLVPAGILPFVALLAPHREVVQLELPSDALVGRSRVELEGMLRALDEARARGDMDQARHANAKARIEAALAKAPAGKRVGK